MSVSQPVAVAVPGGVGGGEKLAFFLGNVGNIILSATINAFLLIFYTDVVGLNPIAVGSLFLISRFVDGINDPIVGFIVDHLPRTSWGRFRSYLLLGAFFGTFTFAFLFIAPAVAPGIALLMAYVSYLMWGVAFDLMDIPLNSLIPAMTEDSRERNSLAALKGFSYVLGLLAITVIFIPLVQAFGGGQRGYVTTVALIAGTSLVLSVVAALGVRERVVPTNDHNYGFRQLFTILFRTPPLLILFFATLLVISGLGARTASNIFYFTYNVGQPALIGVAGLALFVPTMISALIVPRIANRFGKKQTYVVSLVVSSVGAGALFFVPFDNITLIMLTKVVSGIGLGGVFALFYSLSADVVDYVEVTHGWRAEGAVAAINSFVTKAAGGIGAALPGYVLGVTGYVPNVEQTAEALRGILHANASVPLVFGLIAAAAMLAYSLTDAKHRRIVEELDARRVARQA